MILKKIKNITEMIIRRIIERERERERKIFSNINNKSFYFYIRGHIRESFNTKILYFFIKILRIKFPNVIIIFQTWNNIECKNNESWKEINEKDNNIDLMKLKKYFKNEIIDNTNCLICNSNIKYHGLTEGNICLSPAPRKGWKNMWFGINEGFKKIKDEEKDVVLFRYDYFDINQSKMIGYKEIIEFIEEHMESPKIKFYKKDENTGVDNFFIGNVKKVRELIELFYFNLDEIEKKYPNEVHQEFLVPKIANNL